jgi:hypothetical protein
LIESGFVEVRSINLPDGSYPKAGGGYQIEVLDPDNVALYASQPNPMYYGNKEHNGYVIVTEDGIRGSYNPSRDTVNIKDGEPMGVKVYKIFSKKLSDKRDSKIEEILNEKETN